MLQLQSRLKPIYVNLGAQRLLWLSHGRVCVSADAVGAPIYLQPSCLQFISAVYTVFSRPSSSLYAPPVLSTILAPVPQRHLCRAFVPVHIRVVLRYHDLHFASPSCQVCGLLP